MEDVSLWIARRDRGEEKRKRNRVMTGERSGGKPKKKCGGEEWCGKQRRKAELEMTGEVERNRESKGGQSVWRKKEWLSQPGKRGVNISA